MLKGLAAGLVLCGCGGAIERERVLIVEVERPEPGCGPRVEERHGCSPLAAGKVETTPSLTDLSIDGLGYFEVSRGGRRLLTRHGAFTVGPDGRLVNLAGDAVQGVTEGKSAAGDLVVGPRLSLPKPTSEVVMAGRLDPNAALLIFDPREPNKTSNVSFSVTIYDALGSSYDLTVFVNRTATGSWEFHALIPDGAALTGGTAGAPAEVANGTLTFDTVGRLDAVTQIVNFTPVNATTPQPLTLRFGDPVTAGGTGLSGIVQLGPAGSECTFTGQNGNTSGTLSSFRIDREGRLVGTYSNDREGVLGRIRLTRAGPQSLRHVEGPSFELIEGSEVSVGFPSNDLFGALRPQSLEQVCQ